MAAECVQIFSFNDYVLPAIKFSQLLASPLRIIKVHRFPDGEISIRLPEKLAPHMVIIRSLNHPNEKLIELLLSCKTARQNGVKRITLIAPYLCYMRQDRAFHRSESISQQVIGKLLAELVDDVITVDPHLHRIQHLAQAIACKNAISITAMDSIAEHIKQQGYQLIVGPDSESEQWVAELAAKCEADYLVASKQRLNDRQVRITLPKRDLTGKKVLIADDMISTGHTIAECSKLLRRAAARQIDCVCTHALYDEHAEGLMKSAGISTLLSSDSIAHPSNRIALGPALCQALRALP